MPMILQNNQNNAMAQEDEICFTLVASMGMGGGYVPMIVDTVTVEDEDHEPTQDTD